MKVNSSFGLFVVFVFFYVWRAGDPRGHFGEFARFDQKFRGQSFVVKTGLKVHLSIKTAAGGTSSASDASVVYFQMMLVNFTTH